jgi:hypothetical protein
MKKNLFLMAAITFFISISSCGSKSSFDSDVRKMANYRCKEQQLMAKDQSDAKIKSEMEDLQKEMAAYRQKMAEKYKGKEKDEEMNKKADQIMEEVMAKCK